MLSIKYIRENLERVQKAVTGKRVEVDLDEILELDKERRNILSQVEELKAKRNRASAAIALKKRQKEDAAADIAAMKELSTQVKELDEKVKTVVETLNDRLLYVPNTMHESVPPGIEDTDNLQIRQWGEPKEFAFTPHDHLDIAEAHYLLDLKRATKMSGSGFPLYTGKGARLERSLINFMLDYHLEHHNYLELFPPFLTTREATQTTGQLPKFAEDMYHIPSDDLFCISTAEVPVTNIHRDEIILESQLPRAYMAYSACFRREAGSYGKDNRGLLRVHQFNKVEMLKFVKPETSYDELESLTKDAEEILQALGLHYRVVALCAGDLSFSAAKCYDLEVWAPGTGRFLEVSSCSNFENFQARRGNIRYRRSSDQKVDFVHTLNGSGVATPRLMAAMLETYQQEDGSVLIPEALQSYMKTDRISTV